MWAGRRRWRLAQGGEHQVGRAYGLVAARAIGELLSLEDQLSLVDVGSELR